MMHGDYLVVRPLCTTNADVEVNVRSDESHYTVAEAGKIVKSFACCDVHTDNNVRSKHIKV